jgi:nucleoside diphosphate kinase
METESALVRVMMLGLVVAMVLITDDATGSKRYLVGPRIGE